MAPDSAPLPVGGDKPELAKPWNVATVEQVEYGTHHDERTNLFIQWKGTDVCFDFYCECGQQSHFDGYFAYSIQCPACGVVVLMPATVYPLKATDAAPDEHPHNPVVPDVG